MFEIIAIGDGEFLYQILNFLALLGSSNMFMQLGLLGALLGIVFSLLQSITSGGKDIPIASSFVGVMLFMVMFGQSATVTVEDYYSGRTRVIDNVPMGTAIIGSLISQIGIGVTEKFMQASAIPGTERLPYQYVLDALMASRDLTDGDMFKDPETRAFARTAQEYVSQCAMQIYRGNGNRWADGHDPATADDAWAAMMSTSQSYTMQNFMDQGAATNAPDFMTCASGWTMLNNYMSTPKFKAAIASIMKRHLHKDVSGSGDINEIYTNVFAALNQSAGDAQLWLKNSVVSNLARKGVQQSVGKDDVASAVIVETAVNQRNVQFSAESSLWLRMARGIMTFFEGVAYGMAPFAALLIPFGAYGIRIGMRYAAVLLWIFLWTPLLSFVNMFTIDALSGQLDALQTVGGAPLHSIIGIMEAQYTAMDYIGISGWMAPTVASLAGFFVFGGLAAFSGLAARVNGADFVNEGMVAPNALTTGSLMERSAVMQSSPGGGAMQTDAPNMSWQFGNVASQSAAFKEAHSRGAFQEFGSVLKEGLKESANVSDAVSTAHNLLDNHRAGTVDGTGVSKDEKVADKEGDRVGSSHRAGGAISATDTGTVGVKLALRGSIGPSAGANTDVALKREESSNTNMDSSRSLDRTKETGFSEKRTADEAHDIAKSLALGEVTAQQLGVSADRANEVVASARKAYQASEAYEESAGLARSNSSTLTISEKVGSQALVSSGNLGEFFDAASRVAPTLQDRMSSMEHGGDNGGPKYATSEQRMAAATLLALGDAANDSSLPVANRELAADLQTQALSYAAGGSTGGADLGNVIQGVGAGSDLQPLVDGKVVGADAAEAQGSRLQAPGGSVDGVFGEAGSGINSVRNTIDQTDVGAIAGTNARLANAIGTGAMSEAGNAAMTGQLEERFAAVGLADTWRSTAMNLAGTQAGNMSVNQAAETASMFNMAYAGAIRQGPDGNLYTNEQMALAQNVGNLPVAKLANEAYKDYPELAGYSTLAGLDSDTRALLGVTESQFNQIGASLSSHYGADTVAAVKSMGAAGLEGRPQYGETARMLNQTLKEANVGGLLP